MRHDLFIAGFGGQGVLLAGNLLGYAAMDEGLNVSFFPAYGVEKRGGAAMCTIVISDGETGSPVVGTPSVAILLNQLSWDKYHGRVAPGGRVISNATLVDPTGDLPPGVSHYPIAMNDIALSLGDGRLVNMVAVGAYLRLTGLFSPITLERALKKALPERNHRFIPSNLQAIDAGRRAVEELQRSGHVQ
ncbi:MAG: 2-oxoacid:acceptor oxidoreductase family protein [Desulfuromonadia bacterium]